MAQGGDQRFHRRHAVGGIAVRGDHLLVDPPADLDRPVLLEAEEIVQPLGLPVGQEVGAGVQCASRTV